MKKIINVLITIILVLSNVNIVFAITDITEPTLISINVIEDEVKPGEEISIQVEAYDDESGLDESRCNISFKHETSSQWLYVKLTYNSETKMLEGKYTIPLSTISGEWNIYEVWLYDKVGNVNLISDYSSEGKFNDNFKVIGENNDITKPELKSINIIEDEVKPGEEINVQVEAYDDESGLDESRCNISFKHETSSQWLYVKLTYNSETKMLEGKYTIPLSTISGKWNIYEVWLYDKAGNVNLISDYSSEGKFNDNFKVIGENNDITKPELKSINIIEDEVKPGEEINVQVEAYDDESGLDESRCNISFKHETSSQWLYVKLTYNSETKMLEGKYTIPLSTISGKWNIYEVWLYDKAGNVNLISDYSSEGKFNDNFIINSIFEGSENKVIKVNSQFDELDQIKATSKFEGDITENIKVIGNVDMSKCGVYLLKYEVLGKSGNVYRDYRWITVVNNIITDEEGNKEVYFNKDIELNLSEILNKEITKITKDGQEYYLDDSGVITEEGIYNISFNEVIDINYLIEEVKKCKIDDDIRSDAIDKNNQLQFIVDKTKPKVTGINLINIIEEETIKEEEIVSAYDNYGRVLYSFVNEPDWSKIGNQKVNINISDAAGNSIIQEVEINITDKCDIDNSGKVDILDISSVALKYNIDKNSSEWNDRFDFNKDKVIDIFDLVFCSRRIN